MARIESKSLHVLYFLTLVFALILIPLTVFSGQEAFAMGQAPGTCPNRYDSVVTEMILNNGTHTFDPLQNPDLTFQAQARAGYAISMTLHTADQSSNGNQENGTTWINDNMFGYSNGACVYDVGSNENKTLNLGHRWNFSGMGPPHAQYVYWNTWVGSGTVRGATYNVLWYDEFAPRDLSATAVSSSQINLNWSPPLNDGGVPITGYRIDRYTSASASWSTVVDDTRSTSTTYSDIGLSPSTTYDYHVFAKTSSGTSPTSNYARATTFSEESAPTTANLTVHSADMSGNAFEGMWVELWKDGEIIQEWFTPFSASIQTGDQYEIFMDNWQEITFDHWEDDTAANPRPITISENTTITAFFQTPAPTSSSTITVQSVDMDGNEFPGQWVELWQDGVIIEEDFTPFSADINTETQYEIFIYDDPNEDKFFDHWEDGTAANPRPIITSEDTVIIAFFQTASGPIIVLPGLP